MPGSRPGRPRRRAPDAHGRPARRPTPARRARRLLARQPMHTPTVTRPLDGAVGWGGQQSQRVKGCRHLVRLYPTTHVANQIVVASMPPLTSIAIPTEPQQIGPGPPSSLNASSGRTHQVVSRISGSPTPRRSYNRHEVVQQGFRSRAARRGGAAIIGLKLRPIWHGHGCRLFIWPKTRAENWAHSKLKATRRETSVTLPGLLPWVGGSLLSGNARSGAQRASVSARHS